MVENDRRATEGEPDSTTLRRRALIKTAGAGIVGTTGLAAASGSAAAQSVGTAEVDLSSDSPDSLPTDEELLIFVHGWFGNTGATAQARQVYRPMADAGYEATPVAGVWNASNPNIVGAQAEATDAAETLVGLIETYKDETGGTVRLLGHSLGGLVVLETLAQIDDSYAIDTVAPMGAAVSSGSVCTEGTYGSAIVDNAGEVRNYYSTNDTVIGSAYGAFGGGLGSDGADCSGDSGFFGGFFGGGSGSLPDNFTDVDVSDDVGSHLGYLGSTVIARDLVESFDSDDSSGGSDGSGSDGDGGSSSGDSDPWGGDDSPFGNEDLWPDETDTGSDGFGSWNGSFGSGTEQDFGGWNSFFGDTGGAGTDSWTDLFGGSSGFGDWS